jgi:hypothetical protein
VEPALKLSLEYYLAEEQGIFADNRVIGGIFKEKIIYEKLRWFENFMAMSKGLLRSGGY